METSPRLGQGGKKGTHASVNLSLSPSARRMKGRRRKDRGKCGRRTGGLFGREKDELGEDEAAGRRKGNETKRD